MVKLFVEGGGDKNKILGTALRQGFSEFLKKAGVSQRPRVISCGGRQQAYEDYLTAVNGGEPALLLVDSEDSVSPLCSVGDKKEEWDPWLHLAKRKGDQWVKPSGADKRQCHLMVVCMETWILADQAALKDFYKKKFKPDKLPTALESLTKQEMYNALAEATKETRNGSYSKGKHSFDLIAQIDPELVCDASPWAERFIQTLRSGEFGFEELK